MAPAFISRAPRLLEAPSSRRRAGSLFGGSSGSGSKIQPITWMPAQLSELLVASMSRPTSENGPNLVAEASTVVSSADHSALMERLRTQSAAVGIASNAPSPVPVPVAISPARMRGTNQFRAWRKAPDSHGRRAVTRQYWKDRVRLFDVTAWGCDRLRNSSSRNRITSARSTTGTKGGPCTGGGRRIVATGAGRSSQEARARARRPPAARRRRPPAAGAAAATGARTAGAAAAAGTPILGATRSTAARDTSFAEATALGGTTAATALRLFTVALSSAGATRQRQGAVGRGTPGRGAGFGGAGGATTAVVSVCLNSRVVQTPSPVGNGKFGGMGSAG